MDHHWKLKKYHQILSSTTTIHAHILAVVAGTVTAIHLPTTAAMDIVIIHIIGGRAHITIQTIVIIGIMIIIQMDIIMDTMMDLLGVVKIIILEETIPQK